VARIQRRALQQYFRRYIKQLLPEHGFRWSDHVYVRGNEHAERVYVQRIFIHYDRDGTGDARSDRYGRYGRENRLSGRVFPAERIRQRDSRNAELSMAKPGIRNLHMDRHQRREQSNIQPGKRNGRQDKLPMRGYEYPERLHDQRDVRPDDGGRAEHADPEHYQPEREQRDLLPRRERNGVFLRCEREQRICQLSMAEQR
jgi:hypothetical protein